MTPGGSTPGGRTPGGGEAWWQRVIGEAVLVGLGVATGNVVLRVLPRTAIPVSPPTNQQIA